MSGVNTCVFGPPLWRILHTVSFAPPEQLRAHSHAVRRFLENLQHVLPCKWCRISYAEFLEDMPPLHATIAAGNLARWMFDLHARVNAKLDASTPKFESIVKRFTVRPVQWTPSDVWDILSLFGLNFTPAKRAAYAVWWDSMPAVLRLGVDADLRVAALLESTPCPCVDGAFIATCLVLEAEFNHRPHPGSAEVRARTQRYAVARAVGGCKSGKCE